MVTEEECVSCIFSRFCPYFLCFALHLFFFFWLITRLFGSFYFLLFCMIRFFSAWCVFFVNVAKGRTNIELREKFILASGVSQSMTPFKSKSPNSSISSQSGTKSDSLPRHGPITKVCFHKHPSLFCLLGFIRFHLLFSSISPFYRFDVYSISHNGRLIILIFFNFGFMYGPVAE